MEEVYQTLSGDFRSIIMSVTGPSGLTGSSSSIFECWGNLMERIPRQPGITMMLRSLAWLLLRGRGGGDIDRNRSVRQV